MFWVYYVSFTGYKGDFKDYVCIYREFCIWLYNNSVLLVTSYLVKKVRMEMECYISLGGTMFHSLSLRKNTSSFSWFQMFFSDFSFGLNKKVENGPQKRISTSSRVCAAPKSWSKYTTLLDIKFMTLFLFGKHVSF